MQVGTQWCFLGQQNNYDGMPLWFISLPKLNMNNAIVVHFIKFLGRPNNPTYKYNLHPYLELKSRAYT